MVSEYYKDEQAELQRIKKNIENAFEYFRDNYDRFNDMQKFVFVSSMDANDESINKTLDRPSVEFNVVESYVSRLRGEFAKHQPSIEVGSEEEDDVDPEVIRVVDGHMRYILFAANKNSYEFNTYTDTLSGGFSTSKVYTDYTNEMSFHQDIFVERTFDPTMTFFDPLARKDDKSDGRFCGECFPMYKEEFEENFPGFSLDKVKANSNVGNFKWSYKAQSNDVVLIAYYYEKKMKRKTIVLLTDNRVMTMKEYNKLLRNWAQEGIIEQPPQIIGKPRTTNITSIIRYTICESCILKVEDTDYDSLPIVFTDGNSVLQKDQDNTSVRQYTRPIVYQARGAQKLKNFVGQALTNEFENIPQHKWMVPLEGIPPLYKDAYTNVQQASVLVYNAFKDDDPNVPLPPPAAVPRTPIPPELFQTFMGCDTLIQNALGTFDPSIAKLGEREVSGIAIQESLSLSNAAAMPYVVNYLKGLQSVANKILELIPKIYVTPRTIPILTADGKKEYVKINQEGGVKLDYDKNALKVKVEAGPSFTAQQGKAFNEMVMLMKISEPFNQFMNEVGLPMLLDNMEFRGVDLLRKEADEWMERVKQAREQQQNQPNPEQVKMQLAQMQMQMREKEKELDARMKAAELELEKQKLQMNAAQMMVDLQEIKIKADLDREKYHSEDMRKAAEMVMKVDAHSSKMSKEQKMLEESLKKE